MSIRIHLPNKGTLNPVEHLSLSLLPLQLLPPVSGPCTHCSHPEASRAFPVLFVAPDSHNPAALPVKPAEYPFQWFVPSVHARLRPVAASTAPVAEWERD